MKVSMVLCPSNAITHPPEAQVRNVFGPIRRWCRRRNLLIEGLSLPRPATVQAASRDVRSELNAVLEMEDDATKTPNACTA